MARRNWMVLRRAGRITIVIGVSSRSAHSNDSPTHRLPDGTIDVVLTHDAWWDRWNHDDLLDAWPHVMAAYPSGATDGQILRLSFHLPSRLALALVQYHLLRKETRGE